MPTEIFSKPPRVASDLAALMSSRGLLIPDMARAERHIKTVGYYRLMGYGRHFFDSQNQTFLPGTTYDHIWNAYKFDRKLRLLTLDAIERIEVAVRTAFSNEMCLAHGAHWFMDSSLFDDPKERNSFCQSLRREFSDGKNEITKHYFKNYRLPDLPPAWMAMECISMGTWVRALKSLKQRHQSPIANLFNLPRVSFISWISSLAWVRNVCAHHGLLWNRTNMRPPKAPKHQMNYPNFSNSTTTYFATAVVNYAFLKQIVTRSTWVDRLNALLIEFPTVRIADMGFPHNWQAHPFWH